MAVPGDESGQHDPRLAILQALQAAHPDAVSGEELAVRLQMTRAAVWKHIQRLRHGGYAIEGRAKQGYRLALPPDLPAADAVLPLLRTQAIGRVYEFHPSLDSTNERAKRLADDGAPHGTTIVADRQTAGRGRRGRPWLSLAGTGIWMSVVVRPALPPHRAGLLTLVTGLAARAACAQASGGEIRLKWPNDLYAAGRKVCGILIDMAADQEQVAYAILGIGLNVRTPPGGYPPELAGTAIALETVAGRPLQRPQLVAALCEQLEAWLERWQRAGPDGDEWVLREWRRHALWLGEPVQLRFNDRVVTGIARDVAPDGALLLEDEQGNLQRYYAGDVSLRPRPESERRGS